MKKKIGIMISGGGTNMQAIVNACEKGEVDAEIMFVGADNHGAKGLVWARAQGIPTFIVDYQRYRGVDLFPFPWSRTEIEEIHEKSVYVHERFGGDIQRQIAHLLWKTSAEMELYEQAAMAEVDLLVLAGFMQICTSCLIDRMNHGENDPRIMNIHPALLPAFPGVDGYGDTIRYGCKVGGCTVHFVDYGEDSGPIIGQRAIAVRQGDTVETFRERGLQEEYQLFRECIQLFAEGRLKVMEGEGRKTVRIS